MNYRKLGKSGIEASVLGLGTWAIGGWMWGGAEEKESIRAIQGAVEIGMNLVDTAPVYGFGVSEEVVGKAIKDRRDKVVLATKCGLVWNKEVGKIYFCSDDDMVDPRASKYVVHRYLGPKSIREEVELSLRRLQTDYIDLYQTHWQDPTTPPETTMEELMRLKEDGKIRAIGVSNATPEICELYRKEGVLDSDQELYSMLDRGMEKSMLPYCEQNNMAFLAYSPLAQGLLTGKVTPGREFDENDQRNRKERFTPENRRKVLTMLDEFRPIAEAHDITLAQLAIAWTAAQPGSTHVLCGARSPEQVRENAVGGEVELSEQELATINAAIAKFAKEIP